MIKDLLDNIGISDEEINELKAAYESSSLSDADVKDIVDMKINELRAQLAKAIRGYQGSGMKFNVTFTVKDVTEDDITSILKQIPGEIESWQTIEAEYPEDVRGLKHIPDMTLADYAFRYEDGQLDVDVCDTEIDMAVCFSHDFNVKPAEDDKYEQFVDFIGRHVKVKYVGIDVIEVDFSGFLKPFNEKLNKVQKDNDWRSIEFEDDELYYDFVLWMDDLLSGYEAEKIYEILLETLKDA